MPRSPHSFARVGAGLLLAALSLEAGDAAALTPAYDPCPTIAALHRQADVSLPFEVVDGRIHVDVSVNGTGPHRFAVDTGASGLGRIDASLVRAMALAVTHTAPNSDGVTVAAADVTRVASLDLGGRVIHNVDLITRNYNGSTPRDRPIAGILGRAFFADGLLLLDYPGQRLSFVRDARLAERQPGVLAYTRAFRVPVRLGDTVVDGNLDTGANVGFVLPRTLFDRVGGGPVVAAADGTLSNTVIRTETGRVAGPIRVGALVLRDAEVRISDRFPELLVGAHALANTALLIDQRSQLVALCPPGPPTPRAT